MWPADEAWFMATQSGGGLLGFDDAVLGVWRQTNQSLLHETGGRCVDAGVTVVVRGHVSYPAVLDADIDAPAVLFCVGDLRAFRARRVGIIGTRRATQSGRHFARTLGGQLASSGVSVVSGLARGIDVESHRGALDTTDGFPPIAVVAGGPDVVYPREHAGIWRDMGERGLIVSELPPGVHPEPYRFPQRNRVLAALSEIVVVVESRETGGSMITVHEAMKRDIPVMAVPGSPLVGTSSGTNELLRDGCAPVTTVDDVLIALGLDHRRCGIRVETRNEPAREGARVLDALADVPRTIDEIALSAGLSVVDVAVALGRLESDGWVACTDGWWEALTR